MAGSWWNSMQYLGALGLLLPVSERRKELLHDNAVKYSCYDGF